MYYVYRITNRVNGKVYIGISKDPHGRWKSHRVNARMITENRTTLDRVQRLHRAMAKYGAENFTFEVIENVDTDSRSAAGEREKYWIAEHHSYEDSSKGYNSTPGGDGGPTFKGRHHTKEFKQKMSEIQKNRSPEWQANFKKAQQNRSEEWCQHISESHKGHQVSDITRQRMSEAWIKRKARGPIFSEETRRRMSEANKGRKVPDEFRASTSKRRTEQEMNKHIERAQLIINERKTAQDVSTQLGIAYRSVTRSLNRLQKLGLIGVSPAGEWCWTADGLVQLGISQDIN